MRTKLIQIALGAIGSIIAVLAQHLAGVGPDVAVAVGGGVLTNGILGGVVEHLATVG